MIAFTMLIEFQITVTGKCNIFKICLMFFALWLFLTEPWVGLQCVIVVFAVHAQLLFLWLIRRSSLVI